MHMWINEQQQQNKIAVCFILCANAEAEYSTSCLTTTICPADTMELVSNLSIQIKVCFIWTYQIKSITYGHMAYQTYIKIKQGQELRKHITPKNSVTPSPE
jgi:hypothetical protein